MDVRLKLMCSVILLSLSSVICSDIQWPNTRHSNFDDMEINDMAMVDSGKDSEVDLYDINYEICNHNVFSIPPPETYETEEFDDENTKYIEEGKPQNSRSDQNELTETKIDSLIQNNARVVDMLRALDMKINVLNERSSESIGLMHYLEIMNKLNSIHQYITNPSNTDYRTTQPVLLEPHQISVIENFIAAIGEENKPETQMCDTSNKITNNNGRCNNRCGGCNTDTSPKLNCRDKRQAKRKVTYEPNKQHCHQLETRQDGIYKFGSLDEVGNEAGRFFHEQYCEFDAAGNAWTVIQRRFVSDHKENFNRSWAEYKHGFGELDKEFWFGNDFIHKLTWDEVMELLIVQEDYTGRRQWVEYSTFQIADEDCNYNLMIGGHRGTIRDNFLIGNDQDFSTYDRPNDNNEISCAKTMGIGWWFNNCTDVFARHYMGMKTVKMMVRPKGLRSGQSNDNDDFNRALNTFIV